MNSPNSLKVGTFFVLALVLLGAVFELVVGRTAFFGGYGLRAHLDGAMELKQRDEVRLAGVPAGEVSRIELVDDGVVVHMRIRRNIVVRPDTIATVRMTGLLGQNYIHLSLGDPTRAALQDGDWVEAGPAVDIAEVLRGFSQISDSVGDLVDLLTGEEGVLSRAAVLLAEDGALQSTLRHADAIGAGLRDGRGTLGRLLADAALYDQSTDIMTDVAGLVQDIRGGQGTLGKLIADDTLYVEATRVASGAAQITEELSNGDGTIPLLLRDRSLHDNVNETFDSLNSILRSIAEGEGTVGKAIQDDELYTQVQSTLNRLSSATDSVEDQGPLAVLGLLMGQLL